MALPYQAIWPIVVAHDAADTLGNGTVTHEAEDGTMMVDTTVYGYVGDGYVVHADCVSDDDDMTGMGRVYSLDDTDPHGLACDTCGGYIFEPDPDAIAEEVIDDTLRRYFQREDGLPDYQRLHEATRAVIAALRDESLLALSTDD